MWIALFRLLGWLAKTFPRPTRWLVRRREKTVYLAARMVIGDKDLPEM